MKIWEIICALVGLHFLGFYHGSKKVHSILVTSWHIDEDTSMLSHSSVALPLVICLGFIGIPFFLSGGLVAAWATTCRILHRLTKPIID